MHLQKYLDTSNEKYLVDEDNILFFEGNNYDEGSYCSSVIDASNLRLSATFPLNKNVSCKTTPNCLRK